MEFLKRNILIMISPAKPLKQDKGNQKTDRLHSLAQDMCDNAMNGKYSTDIRCTYEEMRAAYGNYVPSRAQKHRMSFLKPSPFAWMIPSTYAIR